MNLNNGVKTTFGYWGVGGTYDTSGGYYGRLWKIKSAVGANVRQDVKYTWNAAGDLASRQDVKFLGTESFTYDFLDRYTAASGAYTQSYTYNAIGNILTWGSNTYTYGSGKPHAVTQIATNTYSYDSNGNLATALLYGVVPINYTWDVENRLVSIVDGSGSSSAFVYDGDSNRVKKTEGNQTTIYVGKYYEKNTSTGTITTYYYLGDRLVALRNGTNLRYTHLDHLGSTSVVTNTSGAELGHIRYYPSGGTRDSSGSLDTEKKFTGQRYDSTFSLYYYGARYYDPTIGRFISPDTIVSSAPLPNGVRIPALTVSYHIEEYSPYTSGCTPWMMDPQELNRYSYALNNPLKYTDPEGNQQTNPIAQAAQALWQSGVPQLRVLAWGLLIAAGAYEIYNTQQGSGSSVGSTLVEVVNTAVDLTKTVVGKIGNYLFSKKGDSDTAKKSPSTQEGRTIEDAKEHPENWEKVGDKIPPEDATGKQYRGGKSYREILRNKNTGDILERHTIYDRNGNIVHQNWAIPR